MVGTTIGKDSICLQRRALLGAVGLSPFFTSQSLAMWAAASDSELIQSSPLVVLGTWVGQAALTLPGAAAPMQVGVVAVSETLKGAASGGAPTVVFVAVPNPGLLRASSDIHYRKGDSGLWLLRSHPGAEGLYLADSPQRFVPTSTGAARIDSLRRAITAR